MSTQSRKKDHIDICLTREVQSGLRNSFDDLRLVHCALPELSLADIDTRTTFFNHALEVPLMISSMTGGTDEGKKINRNLARAAQYIGCAMGLGSMRVALEEPKSMDSFQVRDIAPDVLLFANVGIVQLNYGLSVDDCVRLVADAEADGLILHLNPLQEALQPEGDTNFRGLLPKLEQLCSTLDRPVIAKEVGWGISTSVANNLLECGISAIDVAGAGGTSWSEVEKHRTSQPEKAEIASSFKEWGLTAVEAITSIRKAHPDIPLIASGGLRNGIDLVKSIALGANLGGLARKLLSSAVISSDEVIKLLSRIIAEMRIAMFAAGAENLKALTDKIHTSA